jgi:hypothetical protein
MTDQPPPPRRGRDQGRPRSSTPPRRRRGCAEALVRGFEWQVVRLGADIGLRCLTCGRRVLERAVPEEDEGS